MKDYKVFNPNYKFSRYRRVHQRTLNQAMRRVNASIATDSLWRGRFIVRSNRTSFYRHDDKSGYEYYVELIFKDKRTGKTWSQCDFANSLIMFGGNKIYYLMNKFITEIADVWRTEGQEFLYNDETDYTKI